MNCFLRVMVIGLGLSTAAVCAAAIDTAFLQRPWPGQIVQELEVGRHEVHWRQRISRTEGLCAGVTFTAPIPRTQMWQRATAYADIGRTIPGVLAVRYLEQRPERQVLQIKFHALTGVVFYCSSSDG